MSDAYHHNALLPGATVDEYRLIEVLGEGGFGIVYRGEGRYLGDQVAIKEYLPRHLATRTEGTTVAPTSSDSEEAYAWGLKKFQEEARILWGLAQPDRHPNIVAVRRFFEANGTTYMVMDFEEARPLSEILKGQNTLPQKRLELALFSLLSGLQRVHEAGVWHRDIKPANILIRDDGSPVLLDFGAARQTLDAQTRSIVAAITPPYAAFEQYAARGNDGPWTDIYALGVTLYRCITGKLPPDAAERVDEDTLTPLSQMDLPGYTPAFLAAVEKALEIRAKDRPQSVEEWRALFEASGDTGAVADDTGGDTTVLKAFDPAIQPKEAPPTAATPLLGEHERIASSGQRDGDANRKLGLIGAAIAVVVAVAIGATIIDFDRLLGNKEWEAWQVAKESRNEIVLADYIRDFPEGEFRQEAEALLANIRQEIERAEIQRAKAEAEAEQAALAEEMRLAKERTDAEAWERAQEVDSVQSYNAYLTAQPQGAFTADARNRLEGLTREREAAEQAQQAAEQARQAAAEAKAKADAEAAALARAEENALREKAEAEKQEAERQAQQAAARAEEQENWAQAQEADSAEAYRSYLARFGDSENAGTARQRITEIEQQQAREQEEAEARQADSDAWTGAKQTDTAQAYQDYLTRFPQGEHTAAAQDRLSALLKPVVTALSGRYVARRNANMRSEASLNSRVLGSLKSGNEIDVKARVEVAGDAWFQVERAGQEAFIYASLLREIPPQEIVAWNELRILLDETFGEPVKPGEKVDAITAFLNDYPDSHRTPEAEAERDVFRQQQAELETQQALRAEKAQRAWNSIRESDDPESYRGFLASYPDSQYAPQAESALARIAAAEEAARVQAAAEAKRLEEARKLAEARKLEEAQKAAEAAAASGTAVAAANQSATNQSAAAAFPAPSISREEMQAFFEDKEYVLRAIITDYNRANRIHVRGAAADPRATKIFSLNVRDPLPPSVGDGRYADVTFAIKDQRNEVFRPFRFGILWNDGEPEIISHSRLK